MLTVAGVVVAAEQSQFGQIKIKTSVRLRKQRVMATATAAQTTQSPQP